MNMKIITRIAVRNIRRHMGKNLLLGIMIFLATSVFIFTGAVIHESKIAWRDFFGSTTTGYVNVGALKGARADMTSPSLEFPPRYVDDRIIRYLDENDMRYSKRIRVGGLKYDFNLQKFENGDNTCDVIGTDLNAEKKGLTNIRISVNGPSNGSADMSVRNAAIVWKQFAERYKLKAGDEISFFMNDSQKNIMPYTFVVAGFFENVSGHNMEVESSVSVNPVVFVRYDYLAEQLGVDEGMCTEVAVWNRDDRKIAGLVKLAKKCGLEFNYADQMYTVVGGITKFISFLGGLIGIFILIVFTVATFNINIMSFMERRKEIGTMIAIGASPLWIVSLLLVEMIGFGVISFGISIAVYSIFGAVMPGGVAFGELGILFSNRPFMFSMTVPSAVVTFISLIVTLVISTAYPMYLSYKINPAEVFREGSI
jgi:ABC-type antimicrobial peptide transport system permease subunit